MRDTNWVKNEICLKLNMDTIYMFFLDEFKKGGRFLYQDHVYSREQLFDLKSFNYLKNFKIDKFDITCTGTKYETSDFHSELACLNEEHKDQIKEYWKFSKDFKNKKFIVFFYNVTAKNSLDNKRIKLNNIRCYLK